VALGERARRAMAERAANVAGATSAARPTRRAIIGPVLVAFGVVAVLAFEVSRWPDPDPNGGWPAAEASGARIVATTGTGPVALVDVPAFKTPMGTGFPIVYAGGILANDPWTASFVVVPCDRLFESVVGARCAGPAEDQEIAALAANGSHPMPVLVTRFDASPRISISIYRP
jgi:hypothetical protein